MKFIYCFIALLCPYVNCYCQNILGLNIGDIMPNTKFINIVNSPDASSDMATYKGKIVILDFMATSCSSCIKVLPLMDSLQKEYPDKLKILLISPEKQERITAFLKRNRYLQLAIIAEDSKLAKLFPHEYISHVVWIDGDGLVKAITHPEYINKTNIVALINHEHINLPLKRDITNYDFNQPFLIVNNQNIPESEVPENHLYSGIMNYMPGVQKYNGTSVDSTRKIVRTTLINRSIIEMYLLLNNKSNFPMSHVLLNVMNSDQLVYDPLKGYYEKWKEEHIYCMEAVYPIDIPVPVQQKKMISDLDFYFNLHASMESRIVNCMILRNKDSSLELIKSNDTDGLRVGTIAFLLNHDVGAMPVFDETKGTTYTALPITAQQVKDTPYLKTILAKYGLEIIIQKREIEFLVITQANKTF